MDFNKLNRAALIAGGLAAFFVLGGLSYWLLSGETEQIAGGSCKPIETVTVSEDDFTIGDAKAPITLVEYASQTCSVCAAFQRDALPTIKATYIETGLVRLVFRDFQRNRVDLAASVLGRCMGREAFMPFTDLLLENQDVWMHRADQDVVAGLREMTRRAGMTNEDFDACMKNEDQAKRLVETRDKAVKDYCVEGTPTFLLNGKKINLKGSPLEAMDKRLRDEMKALGLEAPAAAAVAPDAEAPTPAP
jgi:protein-disulfide isomerase